MRLPLPGPGDSPARGRPHRGGPALGRSAAGAVALVPALELALERVERLLDRLEHAADGLDLSATRANDLLDRVEEPLARACDRWPRATPWRRRPTAWCGAGGCQRRPHRRRRRPGVGLAPTWSTASAGRADASVGLAMVVVDRVRSAVPTRSRWSAAPARSSATPSGRCSAPSRSSTGPTASWRPSTARDPHRRDRPPVGDTVDAHRRDGRPDRRHGDPHRRHPRADRRHRHPRGRGRRRPAQRSRAWTRCPAPTRHRRPGGRPRSRRPTRSPGASGCWPGSARPSSSSCRCWTGHADGQRAGGRRRRRGGRPAARAARRGRPRRAAAGRAVAGRRPRPARPARAGRGPAPARRRAARGSGRLRRRGDDDAVHSGAGVADGTRALEPGGGRHPVDGGTAELLRDADRPPGWELRVEGVPQSYVDVDDPTHLEFAYVRLLGDLLDLAAADGPRSRRCTSAAAPARSPRYVAATRPGSTPAGRRGRRRGWPSWSATQLGTPGSGCGSATPAPSWPGSPAPAATSCVGDVFDAARDPGAPVTTLEHVARGRPGAAPRRHVRLNVGDGGRLAFTRGQAATVREAFAHVGAAVATRACCAAAGSATSCSPARDVPLPEAACAGGRPAPPAPRALVAGEELTAFAAGRGR